MPQQTQITVDDKIFRNLLATLDRIDQRLTSISATTTALSRKSSKITFKFDGVDNLSKMLDTLSRAKVNQISSLIDNLDKLSKLKIGKNTIENLTKLSTALQKLTAIDIKPFTSISRSLSALGNVSGLEDLGDITRNITKLGNAFKTLGGGDIKTANFAKVIDGLGQLSKLTVGEDLEENIKAISRLGSGISKLMSSLANLKGGSSLKLGAFILTMNTVLGLVGSISKRLPGNDTIREMSLTLERLGIGISGLFRNIDKINVKNSGKLAALLTGLTLGFNILSRFAGNTEKLKAMGTAFSGIAALFDSVFKGIDIKNVGKSKSISKVLTERIALIVEVVKAIRGLTGGILNKRKAEDLAAVGQAFQGIGKLFQGLSTLGEGGLKKGSITAFKDFVKALQELNNIKINKNTASGLQGLGNLFSSQAFAGMSQKANTFGGDLSNQVALGFLKGTLVLKVGQVLGRLFTDLNPAVLLAGFANSFISTFARIDKQVTQILNNLVNRIQTIGNNLKTFGTNLISNFGVGTLFSSQGFQIAAEFDELANRAQVFGNLTEGETEKVLGLADAIGIQYPLSANEALKAIINLQKAGLGVADLENAIAPIADLTALSESGNIDEISRIVIQTVSSFKQLTDEVESSFENTAVVADILSRAADSSTASVESLGQGLGNVGPIASQFGLTFEETAAILSIFEDNGIRGAEAGTQLRSVLSNMTRPTEAVQGALAQLGISLTDNQGNFRDLNDIINDFNTAFTETKTVTTNVSNITADQQARLDAAQKAYAKATQQVLLYNDGLTQGALDQETANQKVAEFQQIQQNAQNVINEITGSQIETERITAEITRTQQQNFESINTIFGTFGQQGAAILIGEGTDAIKRFVDEMGRMPTAAERAQQLMDTFNGSVEQLRGSGETLMKNFFLPIIDTIARPFVDFLTSVVNGLLAVNPELLATVSTAVTFGAILATIIGTLSIIVGSFVTFGAAIASVIVPFLTFTGAISFVGTLLGTFLAFIGGIVAFAAVVGPLALILFGVASAFRTLLSVFQNNIGGASDGLKAFTDSIGFLFEGIGEIAGAITMLIGSVFGGDNSLEGVGTTMKNLFESLALPIRTFSTLLFDAASGVRAFVRFFRGADFSDSALTGLADNPFLQLLLDRTGLSRSAEGVRTLFTSLRFGLNQLRESFGWMTGGITSFFELLRGGNTVEQAFEASSKVFRFGLRQLANTIFQAVQAFFDVDLTQEIALINSGHLGEALASVFTRALESVRDLLLNNRQQIKDILLGLFNFAVIPGGIFETIFRALGLDNIADAIAEVRRIISGVFGGIIDTVFNLLAGQDLATAVRNAFGPGIEPIIAFVTELGELVNNVVGFIQDLFSALFPGGAEQVQLNLLDVVNGVLSALTSGLSFLNDSVLIPLRNTLATINFQAIFQFLGNLFSSFGEFFRSLFSGDFGGALNQLSGIGQTLGTVIQDLLASVFGIEFTPNASIIQSVAEAISGVLNFALNGVANLLGFENFGTMAETIFNNIVNAINNFLGPNPAEKFAGIAATILTGLGQAVGDAFRDIGDFLGIDTTGIETTLTDAFQTAIDNVSAFFTNADGTTLFDNLATIFEKLSSALGNLFNTFTGGDGATDSAFTLQDALTGILSFASELIALGLETITAPLAGIGDFIQRMSELDSEKVAALGVAIAGIVGTLALMNPTLSSGISSVVGSITRFAGIAAVIDVIKNLVENAGMLVDVFESITDLDFAGALEGILNFGGETLTGIGFDVLGLFGVDSIFGQTEEDINATVNLIANGASAILTAVGQGIVDFINNTVLPVINGIRTVFETVRSIVEPVAQVLGTIIFAPVILFIKAIQAFADLPQEKKDKIAIFFAAVAAALALYNGPAIVSGIGGVINFIGVLSGGQLATAATGVGAFIGKLTAFGGALARFGSFLATTVAPLAVILVFVASAISNAEKLFDAVFNVISLLGSIISLDLEGVFDSLGGIIGGLTDFIGSTIIDAVFFVAELFGVNEILGQSKEDFERTLGEIVLLIKVAFTNAGNQISQFFTNTFDDLSLKLNIMAADLRLAISDAAARIRTIGQDASQDPFFKAQAIFADPENIDLSAFFSAIGDTTVSQEDLDLFARKNASALIGAFTESLSDPNLLPTDFQFTQLLDKLDLAGAVDNATREALASDDLVVRNTFIDMFARALSLPADQRIITQDQANTIVNSILESVKSGEITSDEGLNILNNIPLGGEGQLSAEQRDKAVAEVNALVAEYQALAEEAAVLAAEQGVTIDLTHLFEAASFDEAQLSSTITPAIQEMLTGIASRFATEQGITIPFPLTNIQVPDGTTTAQFQTILVDLINQLAAGVPVTELVLPTGTIIVDPNVTVDGTEVVADTQTAVEASFDPEHPVSARPDVEVRPNMSADPTTISSDINTAIDTATSATDTTVTPDVTVDPVFQAIESQADVDALNLDLIAMQTNLDTAKGKFGEFATEVNANITNLTNLSLAVGSAADTFTLRSVDITTAWGLVDGVLQTSLAAISEKLIKIVGEIAAIGLGLTIAAPLIQTQMNVIQTAMVTSSNAIVVALSKISTKLLELKEQLAAVMGGINAVNDASINPGGGSGGGAGGNEGRAKGGPVWKGLFEIIENDQPELLFQGGKTFLLSPGRGQVQPMLPSVGMQTFGGIPRMQQASQQPVSNNMTNFQLTEGDININIDGTTQDISQIVPQIRDAVRLELDNRQSSIRDRLRTAGRS